MDSVYIKVGIWIVIHVYIDIQIIISGRFSLTISLYKWINSLLVYKKKLLLLDQNTKHTKNDISFFTFIRRG